MVEVVVFAMSDCRGVPNFSFKGRLDHTDRVMVIAANCCSWDTSRQLRVKGQIAQNASNGLDCLRIVNTVYIRYSLRNEKHTLDGMVKRHPDGFGFFYSK